MEQRRSPRFECRQWVAVKILGEREPIQVARLLNASARGLGLLATAPLPYGAAIEITVGDTKLYGGVVHCRSVEDGFAVGIELDPTLYGGGELADLMRKLEDDPSGTERVNAVQNGKG